MPDDAASPSGGWEEVYGAMAVPTSAGDDAPACPDRGEACPRTLADRYRCPEHGTFAAAG